MGLIFDHGVRTMETEAKLSDFCAQIAVLWYTKRSDSGAEIIRRKRSGPGHCRRSGQTSGRPIGDSDHRRFVFGRTQPPGGPFPRDSRRAGKRP